MKKFISIKLCYLIELRAQIYKQNPRAPSAQGIKRIENVLLFSISQKTWISFFFFIIYFLGYPSGYLKYPRVVELMVFEVVKVKVFSYKSP